MPIQGTDKVEVRSLFPDPSPGLSDGDYHHRKSMLQDIADAFATVKARIIELSGGTAGKKVAYGSAAVTGSLLDIDTGLALIENVQVSLKQTTAGVGNVFVTANHGSDGLLDLYVWKPTSSDDNTLIAGSAPATVYWTAHGS